MNEANEAFIANNDANEPISNRNNEKQQSRQKCVLGVVILVSLVFFCVILLTVIKLYFFTEVKSSECGSSIQPFEEHLEALHSMNYDSYAKQETSYNCMSYECKQRAQFARQLIDKKADPCVDFYQYACGNAPAAEGRWRYILSKVSKDIRQTVIKELSSDLSKQCDGNPTKSYQKARKTFQTCQQPNRALNVAALNALIEDFGGFVDYGSAPVLSFNESLLKSLSYTLHSVFSMEVGLNFHSDQNAIIVLKGLSTRYHFANYSASLISQVVGEIVGSVSLAIDFEEIADFGRQVEFLSMSTIPYSPKGALTMDELNVRSTNISELKELCDHVDWDGVFLNQLKVNESHLVGTSPEEIAALVFVTYRASSNGTIEFLRGLNEIITNYSRTVEGRRAMHNYLIVQSMMPYFVKFWEVSTGKHPRHEISVRNKTSLTEYACYYPVADAMPFALGSMLEKQIDLQASRKKVAAMFAEHWKYFRHALNTSSQFENSDYSKEQLLNMTSQLVFQIGLPLFTRQSKSLDEYYSMYEVTDSALQNAINLFRFGLHKRLDIVRYPKTQMEQPFPSTIFYASPIAFWVDEEVYEDRTLWIWILSGLPQPPYFGKTYIDAFNFGALGHILGHELNHIFYSFERDNAIANISEPFIDSRKECVIEHFGNFSYNGTKINASLTVYEDTADIGGIRTAYNALKEIQKRNNIEPPIVNLSDDLQLTADQLFFVAFAQEHCIRDNNLLRYLIKVDPTHSAPPYRVNGTLANTPEFSAAFSCPSSSPMNPVKKCDMW